MNECRLQQIVYYAGRNGRKKVDSAYIVEYKQC